MRLAQILGNLYSFHATLIISGIFNCFKDCNIKTIAAVSVSCCLRVQRGAVEEVVLEPLWKEGACRFLSGDWDDDGLYAWFAEVPQTKKESSTRLITYAATHPSSLLLLHVLTGAIRCCFEEEGERVTCRQCEVGRGRSRSVVVEVGICTASEECVRCAFAEISSTRVSRKHVGLFDGADVAHRRRRHCRRCEPRRRQRIGER